MLPPPPPAGRPPPGSPPAPPPPRPRRAPPPAPRGAPPPPPATTTAPPPRTNRTTCASSAGASSSGGSSTTSTAGRCLASRSRSNSGVRRRSTGIRRRASTSYVALLPRGPLRNADARKSKSGVPPPLRLPAHTATPTASASSRTSQTSSRRNMLEHQLRLGRELVVRPLVARDGAEEDRKSVV